MFKKIYSPKNLRKVNFLVSKWRNYSSKSDAFPVKKIEQLTKLFKVACVVNLKLVFTD